MLFWITRVLYKILSDLWYTLEALYHLYWSFLQSSALFLLTVSLKSKLTQFSSSFFIVQSYFFSDAVRLVFDFFGACGWQLIAVFSYACSMHTALSMWNTSIHSLFFAVFYCCCCFCCVAGELKFESRDQARLHGTWNFIRLN